MKHTTKSEFYHHMHRWLGDGLLTSSGKQVQFPKQILPSVNFQAINGKPTENF